MKEFRKKTMSVKFYFTCVNDEYFDIHYRNYYDFLSYDKAYSKTYGSYTKTFYKLKTFKSVINTGLDMKMYYDLPPYVCASEIY